MRTIKRILSQLHRYVLWALISAVVWAFVFTRITDASPKRKVTVYTDAPAVSEITLEAKLEEELPDGIKMVKVRHFTYAAFNSDAPSEADILILSESSVKEHLDMLSPIPRDPREGDYVEGGSLYGIKVFDLASGSAVCGEYFTYTYIVSETPNQNYYLCFNNDSIHLGGWNGSADDAALIIAEKILSMK